MSVHDVPFLRPYVSIYVTRKVVGAQRIVILEEENGATKRPQGLCWQALRQLFLENKNLRSVRPRSSQRVQGRQIARDLLNRSSLLYRYMEEALTTCKTEKTPKTIMSTKSVTPSAINRLPKRVIPAREYRRILVRSSVAAPSINNWQVSIPANKTSALVCCLAISWSAATPI